MGPQSQIFPKLLLVVGLPQKLPLHNVSLHPRQSKRIGVSNLLLEPPQRMNLRMINEAKFPKLEYHCSHPMSAPETAAMEPIKVSSISLNGMEYITNQESRTSYEIPVLESMTVRLKVSPAYHEPSQISIRGGGAHIDFNRFSICCEQI
jgi:hypothetical protein